ncbi:hypothetical protein BJX66DRAFT_36527 [Aspergillus keveii]|uniref:Uncharacterized protein n=1 Tax=Aspergillus keveii TaxID=714993 RepID=A0ABR4FTN4_9EURO
MNMADKVDVSEDNAAVPSGASQPTNLVDTFECKSPALESDQASYTAPSEKTRRQSARLSTPRSSRQTLLSPASSPHRNPENNYYRQPACRVFRRVSVLDDSPSYCRDKSTGTLSRSRRFLDKVRKRIQFPDISLDYRQASQKFMPKPSGKMSFFPSRALLFSEERRDYSTKRY